MRDSHHQKASLLRRLIVRRHRRHTWAYVLWLMVYLPTALLFAGELSAHGGAGILGISPLLIPVTIAIAQMIYPTLLAWAVITLPSVVYAGVGVFYLIRNATEKHPQWEYDSSGFILGSIFVAGFVVVCVALSFARPRLRDAPQDA
jgi:hypothetical protein